jgi:hypothetical protein
MTFGNSVIGMLSVACLTACGGGATSSGDTPGTVTYNFVTPTKGSQSIFVETMVDNLNNTLNRNLVENVTAVNSDGSFTSTEDDPSNDSSTTGTVDHTFYPTTYTNNSVGQVTNLATSNADGIAVNCIATPHLAGEPSPLAVGQNWAFSFTEACNSAAPTDLTQSGIFVDAESVTVPAGTFNAYKFESTIVYTLNGTTVSRAVTHWVNASSTDSRTLKTVTDYAYSGTTPAQGSLVTDTVMLQSFQ